MSHADDKLPLSETIQTLREELQRSMDHSSESSLRFRVERVEVEISVAVTRGNEGRAGVKLWVLNAEGKEKLDQQVVQKLKIQLKPESRDSESNEAFINDTSPALPK
ncbi:MAG: hypothetical protein MJE77_13350 [Proteobacteria bacterium]|nr:hypothetical protein [Pseudomonadota bacterium]